MEEGFPFTPRKSYDLLKDIKRREDFIQNTGAVLPAVIYLPTMPNPVVRTLAAIKRGLAR